jgi:hypothetical protein
MKKTSEMSSKELVDEYNSNSGKDPIKKFSDRATAERRVDEQRLKSSVQEIRFPKRAAAIKESWKDEKTKAARSKREGVSVDGNLYRSTHAAFQALLLPQNKAIAFRAKLKAAGTLKFGEYEFKIVKQEELPL